MPTPPKEHQWKPGESGNPAGKPKGRRSLSSIVRDILEEPLDWNLIPTDKADQYQERFQSKLGWEALVLAAVAQAIDGDGQAREWLRKSGYGDKLDLTSDDKPIPLLAGVIGVQGNDSPTEDTAAESADSGDSGGDISREDGGDPGQADSPGADGKA